MKPLPIISNDGFLHMEDLPHNCIFNKVVTGCGGTTVVLSNSEDYVIAVPTTALIINKTGRTNAGSSVLTCMPSQIYAQVPEANFGHGQGW